MNTKSILIWTLFIIAGLSVGATLFSLWQRDDALHPEAVALLGKVAQSDDNDAYFYLLGFDTVGAEPLAAGRELFATMRAAERKRTTIDAPFDFKAPAQRLPRPEGALFCRLTEPDCLDRLRAAGPEVETVLATHRTLLERYRHFLQIPDYATLSQPDAAEYYPSFGHLSGSHRLLILDVFATAHHGNPAAAVQVLQNTLKALRMRLADADTLIGKMVFLSLANDTVEALWQLGELHSQQIAPLPRLTPQERDLTLAMAREFAMAHRLYQGLAAVPNIFAESNWNGDAVPAETLPRWYSRGVFKPHMSSNAVLPLYLAVARNALLSPAAFAARLREQPQNEPPTHYLRNAVGTILTRVAAPDYQPFVARVHDLDVKIALFNAAVAGTVDALENPYYRGSDQAGDSAPRRNADGWYCLPGPLPDDKNVRCLKLSTLPTRAQNAAAPGSHRIRAVAAAQRVDH